MLLPFLFLAAAIAPPNECGGMNTATASGILGGPSILTVASDTCEWVRSDGGNRSVLRVEITALSSPAELSKLFERCVGPEHPLKALGNEAVACTGASHSQQIVGRVRNQAFVIIVSTNGGSIPPDRLAIEAREAATQITGNLF